MSEPAPVMPPPEETPEATPVSPAANGHAPKGAHRVVWRWTARVLTLFAAAIAAAFVSLFTIDLGRFPQIKAWAEKGATSYLDRPMHIGRLSAKLSPGDFVLEDVVIEGKHPGDRPFLRAKRIVAHVPLWTLVQRQVFVQLTLADWHVVIESFADGTHSVPRLTPQKKASTGPKTFTTTVSFVYGRDGEFTYEDHGTPWSVVARNLRFDFVRAENLNAYVGRAQFTGGTVQIQDFKPMQADMTTRFVLDGPVVRLEHIDLTTDGTRSHVNGVLDTSHWPTQNYNIDSTMDFDRMRAIFLPTAGFTVAGQGRFTGNFSYSASGRNLTGEFTSEKATVNAIDFSDLHGSLIWTRERFAVTHGDAEVLGGRTRFAYTVAPFGTPTGAMATFSADYADLDLSALDRLANLRGLRLAGRTNGDIELQWRNGHFATEREGRGHTDIRPPATTVLATRDLSATPIPVLTEPRPFDSHRVMPPFELGADLHYRLDANGWAMDDSWAATPFTYIAFSGRKEATGAARFPFHVTSHDWQESDHLLAGIMSAISGPTGAVEVSGRGTFDGTMTGTFSAPRIEGTFAGDRLRVWDVTWGRATADIVIHDGFVDLSHSRFGDTADGSITANGRFSLGFRKDSLDEINAHVELTNWPMADLRHAFNLDDWPMDGVMGSTVLDLHGKYRDMFGTGRMRIDNGTAWGERFETVNADLELEGTGIVVSRIDLRKSGGRVSGSAHVGWDGTFQFHATGERIPVESLDRFKFGRAPLSGTLAFTAEGGGTFDDPVNKFSPSIPDLFIGSEGIGAVKADLTMTKTRLAINSLNAASDRLLLFANGTIGLDDDSMADMHFRLTGTSLDPYLKFVTGSSAADGGTARSKFDISPYTRAIVSGTIDARGPLSRPEELAVAANVDDATLTLFDYELKNDGPIQFVYDRNAFQISRFRLSGAGTSLTMAGGVDVGRRALDLSANGEASFKILQLFFPVTASGAATIDATVTGSLDAPSFNGQATLHDGRLRPLSSPHSLDALNGTIKFNTSTIDLNGVTGRIGNGEVRFGGNISLDGYHLAEYNMIATGRSMRLRYPQGFNSTVDMNLNLEGPVNLPRLTGTIDVLNASYLGSGQADTAFLGLASGGAAAALAGAATTSTAGPTTPLVLDIKVQSPPIPFYNTKSGRIVGTADLHVGGTFDRPSITGNLDLQSGEMTLLGNRYFVTPSTIAFNNPNAMDPEFNIEATTRPRVGDQIYNIDLHLSGTMDKINVSVTSDPYLSQVEAMALLVGATTDVDRAEQRSLQSPEESQARFIQSAAAQILASPISSRVGSVFDRTLPGAIDTVQITPVFSNNVAFQRFEPSARVTLGKRISDRVYLTYTRQFNTNDEVLLIEYDQSDRLSWVLSRNEDRTFALDFRIRFVF